MAVCKKLKGTITDEFCHQVKFKSTLITFAVADMSSDGFGVVLPGLKYNFHLTGVVPSQVWCSFQVLLHVHRHVPHVWQVICGENLSFSSVLLFLNNIEIDVSSP